jgi:S1-C subfamily serine protease
LFSLTGFWIGLVAGAAVAPLAVNSADEPIVRLSIAIVIVFGFAILFGTAGRKIGMRLSELSKKFKLHTVDYALGAAFSAFITLVIVWLLASMISGIPYREVNRQIQGSRFIQNMTELMPPAPSVLARIAYFIDPFGFPPVFIGPEPHFGESVGRADESEIREAWDNAAKSTVRIEGLGCGGMATGSGFVASEDLIFTNAHVIAGIQRISVLDANGRRQATPVYFDPAADIAVLRADNLAGKPLKISDELFERGTRVVVLGYPGGGPLTATPAAIRQQLEATGRDIYSRGITVRSVYSLETIIEQGNSGGPVVTPDGLVAGMVFARSDVIDTIGYSIVSTRLKDPLALAQNQREISTGSCMRN